MTRLADAIIKYSFYLLFFLVPLVFFSGSYELFEYNKMMLTYAFTIVIAAAWLTKILTSNLKPLTSVKRTPLDIPILLYLAAHILSTIFSIDAHVSVWGYYSRFHEGLLATISYIILYYAAVSNLDKRDVHRIIFSSFASGIIVSLWGIGEHFGGSLSCLFITGKFDDSCWIQDVKNRVFATLGQPNWMAAYLDVLIIAALGFILNRTKRALYFFPLIIFFFVALLFTKSRSGVLGLFAGTTVFAAAFVYLHRQQLSWRTLLPKPLLVLLTSLALLVSLFGLPFSQIENLTLEHFLTAKQPATSNQQLATSNSGYIDIGISESGDIRKIVWEGAVKVWQRYPIFGSGVETFAYAYYLDRPVAHNMVSEWDFLYNKAHNEFLNILATTGTVGFLSYLSLLGVFAWWFLKQLRSTSNQQLATSNLLIPALFAAWVSILVTNFFGFSVVIIGLFFFLIPAFCFLLKNDEPQSPATSSRSEKQLATSGFWITLSVISLITLFLELNLINMWLADKAFAYGKNLDGVSGYVQAYPYLSDAVDKNPDEPTFRDELSYNEAVLANALNDQIRTSTSSALENLSLEEKMNLKSPQLGVSTNELISRAVSDSDRVIATSPNAMPFWKTRTKTFFTLSAVDKKYLPTALDAIAHAEKLAPTDAKVHYNLGILYGQTGDVQNAIKTFEETVAAKPDYRDPRYALGLYYAQAGEKDKARAQMEYILTHIGNDTAASKWLEENK